LLALGTNASTAFGQALSMRDWRYWPFSQTSPWNTPVGSQAEFAPASSINKLSSQMNVSSWTASIKVATALDPTVTMAFSPAAGSSSNFTFFSEGGKPCGNSPAVEASLEQSASNNLAFAANFYSTISYPNTTLWVLPSGIVAASENFSDQPVLPLGSCASPDTDGYLSVFQPNGLVLDTINTVVTQNGHLITAMASYIDAKGDGTGFANGRRASMIPSFAGVIRNGELSSGLIPHALAVIAPQSVLQAKAIWPAAAFDRGSSYSGTIPMGSLLAIPPSVNLQSLGLSKLGMVVAAAAQNYGLYIVDSGGSGIGFLAELGDPEFASTETSPGVSWLDLYLIVAHLQLITNNSQATPSGGGATRAPLAPPFFDAPLQ
jgi:hypothetical protein